MKQLPVGGIATDDYHRLNLSFFWIAAIITKY